MKGVDMFTHRCDFLVVILNKAAMGA
jgi:hypothetical protein